MPVILKAVESTKFQIRDPLLYLFMYIFKTVLMCDGFEMHKSVFKCLVLLFTSIFIDDRNWNGNIMPISSIWFVYNSKWR